MGWIGYFGNYWSCPVSSSCVEETPCWWERSEENGLTGWSWQQRYSHSDTTVVHTKASKWTTCAKRKTTLSCTIDMRKQKAHTGWTQTHWTVEVWKNVEVWIHGSILAGSNGSWGYFLDTLWALFNTGHGLSDHVLCYGRSLLMATSSSNWIHGHDNEFNELYWPPHTVSRPESRGTHLGCGRTRDWQRECAADRSAEIMWCNHVKWGRISKGSFQHLVEE